MVVVDERLEICEQENWLPLRRLFVRTYLKFAWGGGRLAGVRGTTPQEAWPPSSPLSRSRLAG
jgi:hypothetical protein